MSALLPVPMTFSVCSLYFIAAYDGKFKVPLVADLLVTQHAQVSGIISALHAELTSTPDLLTIDMNVKGPVCDAMLLSITIEPL